MAIYSSETNRYLKQKKNRILKYEVIKHGVIIFFLLTILLPLAWVFMLSIKSLNQIEKIIIGKLFDDQKL